MIMSLERSRIVRKPASSRLPRSPVCSQPPRSACAVACGILPVAGHHAVRARHDLADFSRRQLPVPVVEDPHFDPGAREAAGLELRARRVVGLRQPGDGHRALALAEELVQARAEQVDRAQAVGDVHRRAAVGDGLQVAQVRAAGGRARQQPHEHGRRGEERQRCGERRCRPKISSGSKPPLSGITLSAPAARCGRP